MTLLKRSCLLILMILSYFSAFSQNGAVFELTNLTISPANPTPSDSIFITLSGNKLDACSNLDTLYSNVNLPDVGLVMNWSISEDLGVSCGPLTTPYDTTINIGILPPAFYSITISTELVNIIFDPNLLNFQVQVINCPDEFGNIWVTNLTDEGDGSLREAINCANANSGPKTIKFYIPNSSLPTIPIGTAQGDPLPIITSPSTIIDGRTQPGWGGNGNNEPLIKIFGGSGSFTGNAHGLEIRANDCSVFGVTVSSFPGDGIHVQSASNVILGGAGSGNVLTENGLAGIGLGISTFGCQINGNWIGTDDTNALGLGNGEAGIVARNGGVNTSVGLGVFQAENKIVGNQIGAIVDNVSGVRFSKNTFECNESAGIELTNNGNGNTAAPIIVTAAPTEISGTVPFSGAEIEVYLNSPNACPSAACQGAIYLGTAFSTIQGWTLTPPFANGLVLQGGERITATQSLSNNQSAFSDCKVVAGISACTDAQGNIEVTNINDTGNGSLREAINCANSTLGANNIVFNIPGNGPHTIEVGVANGDPLPTITSSGTIIDGGGIILDGGVASWPVPADGLTIAADLCEIYNLVIVNFADDGITLLNANANKIGDVGRENTIYSNGVSRDFWPGIPGGPYNGSGIHLINASSNEIMGNYIGTNAGITLEGGNEYCGILVEGNSRSNKIGSEAFNKANTIYYNETGIEIGGNTDKNKISGNHLKCNSIAGITMAFGGNGGVQVPIIDLGRTDTISGTTPELEGTVELFLMDFSGCTTSPCQGKTLLASQTTTDGNWLFTPPYNGNYIPTVGDIVVLTFTNKDNSTSTYSNCSNLMAPCFINLEIVELENTSCDLENGSVEVLASNGEPIYLYDIGNGNTQNNKFTNLEAGFYIVTTTDFFGCTADLLIEITASSAPQAILNSNQNSTCGMANGMLEFMGTSGVSPYTFSLDGGPTQNDGLFSNLSAGTYQVLITDALGCTGTGTGVVSNNGNNPTANFTFTQIYDTVQFTDASMESSTIFYDFGNGFASSEPNPIHVYTATGTYEACQIVTNSCGVDTLCQQIIVTPAPTEFSVAGAIYREDLAAINNAELTCINSDISDAAGEYEITNIAAGSNCQIAPNKVDIARLGISISDLVLLQRHILFLDTLDSPYKIIAGDVDDSGLINVLDLVFMQRVILFIDNEFPVGKSWRFIPENYIFPNPESPLGSAFPEEINLNGLTQNEIDQDFIGLKVGDVDNSANPINIQSDDPIFLIGNTNIDNNILTLELTLEADVALSGLQGTIDFNPALLKPVFSPNKINQLKDHFSQSTVNFLWWDTEAKDSGVQFEHQTPVYEIQFELATQDYQKAIESIKMNPGNNLAIDGNNDKRIFKLGLQENEYYSKENNIVVFPNPFDGSIYFNSLNQNENLEWRLFSPNGKLIDAGKMNSQDSNLLYENPELAAGVYFMEIVINGVMDIKRMVKI